MIYKNTSVKQIVEKLYRDYAHQEELDLWDLVEWAGEALEFIGAHGQFEKYYADLEVTSHRAPLPCNFHSLLGISYNGSPLRYDSAILGVSSDGLSSDEYINAVPVDDENFPLETRRSAIERAASHTITDGYLVTSFEEGGVLMAYKGIPVDDEGFPKIPDNVYYREAIVNYCQMQLDRQGWRAQKLPEAIYRDSERKWNFFCQGARNQANMPNIDKMEAIKNQWIRLKPQINRYDNFFQDLSLREMKKRKGNEK
jgi:hypothetical protein